MIIFDCPSCGVQLRVKEELAGRMGKCPGCGERVEAPKGSNGSAPVKMGSKPGPGGAKSPVEDSSSEFVLQQSVGVKDYAFLGAPQSLDELGRLGDYRVIRALGAGTMGIVFQAQDPQLNRQVALKVLRPTMAVDASYRLRFLREARATASIEHDHIVPVYHVGEDNGVPFIAMKLLQGETLETRLRDQGSWMPLEEVLRIGQEMAEGLGAAHAKGLVHRDIKPSNIWLEAGKDRVRIIDFGLVRSDNDTVRLTGSGYIVGTPAYMAPEQAFGEQVDHRCDLFSLGCVLYRMCTGQVPFRGRFMMDIVTAVRKEAPRSPREIDPSLPPALADLILGLLAKNPADRPHSARFVSEELQKIRRQPAGSATPDSAPPMSGRSNPPALNVPPAGPTRLDQETDLTDLSQELTTVHGINSQRNKRLLVAVVVACLLLLVAYFVFKAFFQNWAAVPDKATKINSQAWVFLSGSWGTQGWSKIGTGLPSTNCKLATTVGPGSP
jgi:serine/threonine protein kinase